MAYTRVIPRDLFNEANLLKCYGQLYLGLEHLGMEGCLQHDCQAFQIEQSEADGSLTVANVTLTVRGQICSLSRPLNSRREYPLYLQNGDDVIEVFANHGQLSDEMLDFLLPDDCS